MKKETTKIDGLRHIETKTELKRMRILYKKSKKLIKTHYTLTNFKEPVVWLIRRSGDAEFYENAKKGEYEFTKSDGETGRVLLHPRHTLKFAYGDNSIRTFLIHEDYPAPLPHSPIILAETFSMAIDKSINAVNKYKTQQIHATTKMIWTIAIGLAIVIGIIILYKMLIQPVPEPTVVAGVTKQIIRNATILG